MLGRGSFATGVQPVRGGRARWLSADVAATPRAAEEDTTAAGAAEGSADGVRSLTSTQTAASNATARRGSPPEMSSQSADVAGDGCACAATGAPRNPMDPALPITESGAAPLCENAPDADEAVERDAPADDAKAATRGPSIRPSS